MTRKYRRGDDWNAFGQEWALIEADIPEDWVVSKAVFKVGNLAPITFENPVFPIPFSLESYQTIDLKDVTTCYLAIYDEQGRKQTLEGSWTFETEEEVV